VQNTMNDRSRPEIMRCLAERMKDSNFCVLPKRVSNRTIKKLKTFWNFIEPSEMDSDLNLHLSSDRVCLVNEDMSVRVKTGSWKGRPYTAHGLAANMTDKMEPYRTWHKYALNYPCLQNIWGFTYSPRMENFYFILEGE
jgi:hypothetical protein